MVWQERQALCHFLQAVPHTEATGETSVSVSDTNVSLSMMEAGIILTPGLFLAELQLLVTLYWPRMKEASLVYKDKTV